MRKMIQAVVVCLAVISFAPGGRSQESRAAGENTIACRVLEAHASGSPAVTAVVFHQQNKDEQERSPAILRAHSGEAVEIRFGEEQWVGATMFRLKSCFGRGLLLLPSGGPEIKDGSRFQLRLSSAAGKS